MSPSRPRLGDTFRRGSSPPDRVGGLQGLLPPSSRQEEASVVADSDAAEQDQSEVVPSEEQEEPADRLEQPRREQALSSDAQPAATRPVAPKSRQRRTGRQRVGRPPTGNSPVEEGIRLVPVNLDVSVHTNLREYSTRVDRPFAIVVLDAIESTADELERKWRGDVPAGAGRLFVGRTTSLRRRRREPAQQVLLRMDQRDADTLDELVTEWEAPSRSALVTEALRGYLT